MKMMDVVCWFGMLLSVSLQKKNNFWVLIEISLLLLLLLIHTHDDTPLQCENLPIREFN